MIYTVTFNPSLDYIVDVNDFQLYRTNRTCTEQMLPGGKGINVSIVLHNLGIDSCVLGFTAGFTGAEIQRLLEQTGVHAEFIPIAHGNSRINMKLRTMDGTEINGMGPDISEQALQLLLEKLDTLQSGDTLVLAGSIPHSLPDSIYRTILQRLDGRGITTVVDATQDLLVNVLEYHPFLIKPNNHELGDIFGVSIASRNEVLPYAKRLQERGARNVLVSMAGEGAVLLAEDGTVYQTPAPKGKLVNGVGAGDSMVAGFLAGYQTTQNYEHAFRMGVSAGSASAFSENLATKPEIEAIYQTLQTTKKENGV